MLWWTAVNDKSEADKVRRPTFGENLSGVLAANLIYSAEEQGIPVSTPFLKDTIQFPAATRGLALLYEPHHCLVRYGSPCP